MSLAGFVMLAAIGAAIPLTGLPAFAVIIAISTAFAAAGVMFGAIPLALLGALPARVMGLLDTDLLQALPLFVLMGVILNRLQLAAILFNVLTRVFGLCGAAAPVMAGLTLGAALAPMNGSVGASVTMLARIVRPRLMAAGVPAARAAAVICAASTLGVAVPPSLVLILFGDAMMRAHTEALNITGAAVRVLNTQDIFRAALIPACLLFGCFLLVGWWMGRGRAVRATPLGAAHWLTAAVTLAALLALLGAVTLGYLYAVEAAAAGATALFCVGLITGQLRGQALRDLLAETLAITGALFALFLAATTFTLVFRAFGTDRLLTALVTAAPGGATGALVLVLASIGLCALVLDAFEIILMIVPLLLPPLLTRVADPAWTAVLVLLVLQGSFLIPPIGYAVMLTRAAIPEPLAQGESRRALMPFLVALGVTLAAAAAYPPLTHGGTGDGRVIRPIMTDQEARQRMLAIPAPGTE